MNMIFKLCYTIYNKEKKKVLGNPHLQHFIICAKSNASETTLCIISLF